MLELRTLGALDLVRPDGTRLHSVIAQPKRAAVLIYLAMSARDEFVRRDVLLPLFWPERDEAAARHALSQTLYKLRQAIGPDSIEAHADDEMRLSATALRCDADLLLAAVSAARWSEALQLYRGDFLPGLHLTDAAGFERWLETTRQHLRTAAGRAAWSLAKDQVARGALIEAEETAVRALEQDGANEAKALAFLRSLASAGATHAAIRYYERFRERLKKDYELDPSSESQSVVDELRAVESKSRSMRADDAPAGAPHERPDLTSTFRPNSRRRMILGSMAVSALIATSLLAFKFATSHAGHIDRPIRALVVLPFQSLMKDEGQAYFVDGMHEAVIEELAHISSLRVTSRTSALHYRGSSAPLPEIARELDVDGVIEGLVLRSGDSVKISVQLVAANPERHLWAGSYTRPLASVLKLHSDVARDIATKVAASVTAPEAAHLSTVRG